MWPPSLETASAVAGWANIALIASLAVGVVATVLIVWMGNLKEEYWDRARSSSNERIAELSTQAEQARSAIAKANSEAASANERAAEANRKAEEEKLARLKLEASLAPRRLSGTQIAKLAELLVAGKGANVGIYSKLTDAEAADYGLDFKNALEFCHWNVIVRTANWLTLDRGVFIGMNPATDRSRVDQLKDALSTIGINANIKVMQSNDGTIPGGVQPGIVYLLIAGKPEL